MISPLALPGAALREGCPDRGGLDWGTCWHTTGEDDGINARILARAKFLASVGRDPLLAGGEIFREIYAHAEFYPHYLGGWLGAGDLHAIADESKRVPHAGLHETQREQYLSGAWRTSWILYDGSTRPADADVVERWCDRWPRWRSPQHLFPGSSPNDVYIGAELVPVVAGIPGLEPMRPGLKYTRAQHELVAALHLDFVKRARNAIPLDAPNHLVGHEDVNPMDRPGWDPGALRRAPWFDWAFVRDLIAKGS